MDFNFNLGIWGGVFAVPNAITDNYIKIATGDNLKVLLYCLRHAGQELTAGEVSRATGIPPDCVTTSLEFWNNISANAPTVSAVSPVCNAQEISAEKISAANPNIVLLERDYEYKPSEIADVIKNNKDADYLFKRCEELYGRLLKPNEQQALIIIIEEVGMCPGVALMLIEFCFSINKTAANYIKKAAKIWTEQGVNSVPLAEEKIKSLKEYYSVEGELIRLLKVKDIPDNKKPLFEKWLYEYKFSVETIYQAYQDSLEKTGKLQYTYMDRILTGLHENGGKDKKFKNFKKSKDDGKTSDSPKQQDSFNLDEWDKQIMEKYKKLRVN